VTKTLELQERLRRSETLSAMGTLVAGVAHEVRNPLFSISATLDAFEARFGTDARYTRYIQILRGEIDGLASLMQDLIEYGRPPENEFGLEPLSAALEHAIGTCAALAERSRVEVAFDALPDDVVVRLNRRRIEQVFVNVLENALLHSPPGGRVDVAVRSAGRDDGRWLEVEFSDRGVGFRPEDLPRAFEPFFTRRRGGTGLGLSIVKRIVEEHSGRIWIANRPGGGASVTVALRAPEEH
jgi:signal transduction histidine kinase